MFTMFCLLLACTGHILCLLSNWYIAYACHAVAELSDVDMKLIDALRASKRSWNEIADVHFPGLTGGNIRKRYQKARDAQEAGKEVRTYYCFSANTIMQAAVMCNLLLLRNIACEQLG